MDQAHNSSLETDIKWQFKSIFAFKLQHKATCWLISFLIRNLPVLNISWCFRF